MVLTAMVQCHKATMGKFVARATRLYEQEREKRDGSSVLGMYVRRWVGWASGGLWARRAGQEACLGFVYAGFYAAVS